MTQLQSRKSKRGLTYVWDIVVRSITGAGGVRSGLWGAALPYRPESTGGLPGAFHFWKRRGWRFYPVNTQYFIPRSKRPGTGYPVAVLALDPANSAGEWRQAIDRLCQDGTIVIAVELPTAHETTVDRQVATFLEAAWVAFALKIGGLAGSPIHLTWWGCGPTGPVVEQASRLAAHKYYLPPARVLIRPFDEIELASRQAAPNGAVDLTLAKAC
jgi:hypothetical protein